MIGAFIFGHNFNKKLALLLVLSFAALCFSKQRVVSGGAARTMQEYCKEDDAEQALRSSHDKHTVNVLHWSCQFFMFYFCNRFWSSTLDLEIRPQ